MLPARQNGRVVGRAARLVASTGTSAFFTQLEEAQVASSERAVRGDSGHAALESFVDRYLDVYDELTRRYLRGERLSRREQAMRVAYEAALDEAAGEQPGLDPEVNDLVAAVLRAHAR